MKVKLADWQKKYILDGFNDNLRIACTSVGAGKSYALSIWIVLQCLKNPGIRGIIIAQDFGALTKVLIREIKNRCIEMNVNLRVRNEVEMYFPNGSLLYGFSSVNPNGILRTN